MIDNAINTLAATILAQDGEMLTGLEGSAPSEGAPGAANADGTQAPSGGGAPMLLIMLVMLAGIMILTSMSGRKERKKHAALVGGLGKKDKVRAAGGIIGTIIEIKDDELLLETDRSTNTRIRVARSSVSNVISSAGDKADTSETVSASEQG